MRSCSLHTVCILSFLVLVIVLPGDGCDMALLQQCYSDSGFEAPPMASYSSKDLDQLVNLEKYCARADDLKEAFQCAFKVLYDCTMSNPATKQLVKYMPSEKRMGQIVDIACENHTHWNHECLRELTPNFKQCKNNSSYSDEGDYCATKDVAVKCVRSELAPCGCLTVRLITAMLGHTYPEECGPTNVTAVTCDSQDPQTFSDNGALSNMAAWIVTVSATSIIGVVSETLFFSVNSPWQYLHLW